ncbi:MAG TPA: transposase [Verrucomicrobiota bacterium]|nr:transposase [Verrucomicrobiales bacterium]HRI13834.1 transposase [Verrucomicrobiota bacterium]
MGLVAADYDGGWKETLETFWPPSVSLCFPTVAADIDWTRPFEFLDKELQEVTRDADSGRRFVDKLIKVFRRSGQEQWVLMHVEVQSDPDPNLPARMYQYHYRLTDRYRLPVASLAILADDNSDWNPGPYTRELWGCRIQFEYLSCKLTQLSDERLQQESNPVALVIAAQRAAQRTVRNLPQRKRLKLELVRQLYARGFERKDVLELLRLIDWQIALPRSLEIAFQNEAKELEKDQVMPYVTSFERLGREEGLQTGRLAAAREAIEEALRVRFGVVPDEVAEAVAKAADLSLLREWHRTAITAPSIEAFATAIPCRH